jgi:putative protein-disulfide isomerase
MTAEFLYFANPMCSWCWGFAPVIAELAARLPVTLAMGALGRGQEPMRPQDRAVVREHWDHVHVLTGQPFDYRFFERDGFVYDTEPACRAVAVLRAQRPELALRRLATLQRAFYAENRDITRPDELRRLAAVMGVDPEPFGDEWASPSAHQALAREFAETAGLGITG